MESFSESYKAAGVDVTAGYQAVELMKKHVASTMIEGVVSDIGGFGGLFQPNLQGIKEPVLVSGTDGVGTKLKLAFLLDKHDTVGIDCVAMCVNDIICSGAQPLFFLDYIAVGKNFPEKVAEIVAGVANGCRQSGCALIGGETAEMPGMYAEDEYDLAGFSVGLVDKQSIFSPENVVEGDVIIGLASSGVHSNGFSLVRKIFQIEKKEILQDFQEELGMTLGEALIEPTKIYVKTILGLKEEVKIKAASHITGGGLYENIPRALPKGIKAVINKQSWKIPAIFQLLQKKGNVPERDMYNTFNMGIGMCVIVADSEKEKALTWLVKEGIESYVIGRTANGIKGIELC
ncbi:MAG: phosphoribosylformylglycinamidine cyclo-ligase [Clostridia bacterium]